eukprot:SAG22_NODE_1304_length_4796_cov_4.746914_2_plen_170_part_00
MPATWLGSTVAWPGPATRIFLGIPPAHATSAVCFVLRAGAAAPAGAGWPAARCGRHRPFLLVQHMGHGTTHMSSWPRVTTTQLAGIQLYKLLYRCTAGIQLTDLKKAALCASEAALHFESTCATVQFQKYFMADSHISHAILLTIWSAFSSARTCRIISVSSQGSFFNV